MSFKYIVQHNILDLDCSVKVSYSTLRNLCAEFKAITSVLKV